MAEELALFANRMRDFAGALPNQGELLESLLLMQSLQQSGFIPIQQMCTTCRHFHHGDDAPFPYYCQLLDRPWAFGQAYLTSLGVTDGRVTADRCRFCHVEQATPEMEEAIAAPGFYILPMEGCPSANNHHKNGG